MQRQKPNKPVEGIMSDEVQVERLSMTLAVRVGDIVPIKVGGKGMFDGENREAEILGITQDGKVMARMEPLAGVTGYLTPHDSFEVFHITGVQLETSNGLPLKWDDEQPSPKVKAMNEIGKAFQMRDRGILTCGDLVNLMFDIVNDMED